MTVLLLAALFAGAAPLSDGIALYQSLEFERAAIHFQGIMLDASAPAAERAQAAMWTGLSLGQLGDVEGARKSFALAVATDLLVEAPADASPALRAILEEERAAAASRPPTAVPEPALPERPSPAEPPVPPPVAAESSSEGANWAAIGSGVAAGVLVVAAAAAGLYGAVQYATSADPTVPVRPAFEAYDASVAAGWTAAGLGGVAAVAGGVSAVLFVLE